MAACLRFQCSEKGRRAQAAHARHIGVKINLVGDRCSCRCLRLAISLGGTFINRLGASIGGRE